MILEMLNNAMQGMGNLAQGYFDHYQQAYEQYNDARYPYRRRRSTTQDIQDLDTIKQGELAKILNAGTDPQDILNQLYTLPSKSKELFLQQKTQDKVNQRFQPASRAGQMIDPGQRLNMNHPDQVAEKDISQIDYNNSLGEKANIKANQDYLQDGQINNLNDLRLTKGDILSHQPDPRYTQKLDPNNYYVPRDYVVQNLPSAKERVKGQPDQKAVDAALAVMNNPENRQDYMDNGGPTLGERARAFLLGNGLVKNDREAIDATIWAMTWKEKQVRDPMKMAKEKAALQYQEPEDVQTAKRPGERLHEELMDVASIIRQSGYDSLSDKQKKLWALASDTEYDYLNDEEGRYPKSNFRKHALNSSQDRKNFGLPPEQRNNQPQKQAPKKQGAKSSVELTQTPDGRHGVRMPYDKGYTGTETPGVRMPYDQGYTADQEPQLGIIAAPTVLAREAEKYMKQLDAESAQELQELINEGNAWKLNKAIEILRKHYGNVR